MKKKFNPTEWLQKGTITANSISTLTQPDNIQPTSGSSSPLKDKTDDDLRQNNELGVAPGIGNASDNISQDVELVISRIESQQTDITANYSDWRDIGFALADEFGERGRSYFQRISRFYPGYSQAVCDKQYDNCLKSNGRGVTLKSFFHLAKQAGINIIPSTFEKNTSTPREEPELVAENTTSENKEKLPQIPAAVYGSIPDFLKDVCRISQGSEEKDILLLGAITTISSCIPKIYGIYGRQKVFSNLYLFVTAMASAGKGMLTHCKRLVYPIHRQRRDESRLLKAEYDTEMNIYNAGKKKNPDMEKPQKPPEKLLYIPANSSATGVFQLLSDNDGRGLIFETEGDTLAITFKSDYGNYSDGFRKAFHHETISYYRRTDRENVEIERPCLSAVLSGTPKQVLNLIPDAENGLFSRFIFYYLEMKSDWKDVFACSVEDGLETYFNDLGNRFYELYKELSSGLEIEFTFTPLQQGWFNKQFAHWQDFYEKLLGNEYIATVRRLGLIAFRMAMIFTVLRIMETGEMPRPMVCEERDFNNALAITEVMVQHAARVYAGLPVSAEPPIRRNREQRFFSQLPQTFSRHDYLKIAEGLNIPDKTAQGYIAKFIKGRLVHRDKKDQYLKTQNEETRDSGD
jgi:hypothetical protein